MPEPRELSREELLARPFPPAPASATATQRLPVHDLTAPGTATARAVTLEGPNGTWRGLLVYSPALVVQLDAWGAGQVTVAVGGRPVTGASFWDYDVNGTTVDLSPETLQAASVAVPATGSTVEVTVTFSDFAHRTWQALIGTRPAG